MKMICKGWSREIYTHEYDLIPAKKYKSIDYDRDSLDFSEGLSAYAKLEGADLKGDFIVEIMVEEEEVFSMLKALIVSKPMETIAKILKCKDEAICEINKNIHEIL